MNNDTPTTDVAVLAAVSRIWAADDRVDAARRELTAAEQEQREAHGALRRLKKPWEQGK